MHAFLKDKYKALRKMELVISLEFQLEIISDLYCSQIPLEEWRLGEKTKGELSKTRA